MRSTAFVVLLVLAGAPAYAQTADEVAACLTRRRISSADISLPGEASYSISLGQSLIQDPVSSPLLYVRPQNINQVRGAVLCAKELDVVFCARSGGHSWAASSTCPGLNIDLQNMRSFQVTGNKMTIGAGRTIGETVYQLYTSTGNIIPVGTCPSVGVGGYIQGGGMGTLSGRLGLLADSVIRLKLISPEGERLVATRTRNPDLFWALRGGGGGYLGVVTEYKLRVFDAAPYDQNVYFSYQWDVANSADALFQWTKYAMTADRDMYIRMTARANRQGISIRGMGICWRVSSVAACEQKLQRTALWDVPGRSTVLIEKSTNGAIEALKFFTSDGSFGTAKPSGPANTQAIFEGRYTTTGFLEDKSWSSGMWDESMMSSTEPYFQGLIDLMASERSRADMRAISMEFYPLGRKAMNQGSDFSAFPHRTTLAVLAVFYNGGLRSDRTVAKRQIQSYLAPYRTGTYVNYLDLDLQNYRREYWGSSLNRIRGLRANLDPNRRMWHAQPL